MSEEEARKRQIEAARATREYAPVMAQEVSMSEHTAGPWELGGGSPDEGEKIVSAPGTNPSFDDPNGREWIATVYDTGPLGPGPNARLIAAAPALLAALEEWNAIWCGLAERGGPASPGARTWLIAVGEQAWNKAREAIKEVA